MVVVAAVEVVAVEAEVAALVKMVVAVVEEAYFADFEAVYVSGLDWR